MGIDLKGVDQVVNAFASMNTPFFAIYSGKELRRFNVDDDIEKATNMLEEYLRILAENGTVAPYKIEYFADAKNGKLSKEDLIGSNSFRLNPPGGTLAGYYDRENGYGMQRQSPMMDKLDRLGETIEGRMNEFDSRLKAMEEEGPETEPKAPEGIAGMVGAIMQDEQVKSVFMGAVAGFLQKFLDGVNAKGMNAGNTAAAPALNGAAMPNGTEMERLQYAIQCMVNAGMTVEDFEKLASIAVNDVQKFNFYIQMLRQ